MILSPQFPKGLLQGILSYGYLVAGRTVWHATDDVPSAVHTRGHLVKWRVSQQN